MCDLWKQTAWNTDGKACIDCGSITEIKPYNYLLFKAEVMSLCAYVTEAENPTHMPYSGSVLPQMPHHKGQAKHYINVPYTFKFLLWKSGLEMPLSKLRMLFKNRQLWLLGSPAGIQITFNCNRELEEDHSHWFKLLCEKKIIFYVSRYYFLRSTKPNTFCKKNILKVNLWFQHRRMEKEIYNYL